MAVGRERMVAPTIPYAFLHGTNGATITTVPIALEWVHAEFINSSLSFTDDDTRIYINRGAEGMYEIDAACGMERAGGNAVTGEITLYVNGVAEECCHAHCMMGAKEHSDCFLHTTVYLKVGDYIEIYANVDAGTATVETDTSRLHLKGILLVGWNNKNAGRNKYPFREE